MKKCIVFLRVSTNQQTLVQQEQVMMEIALKSYSKDEIEIVRGHESASKLDREQRQTLQDMFTCIEENPIERVFFYAVDRLSRKASMVSSITDELGEKGIDCYFHHPYEMHTIVNGERNPLADMMLYFLGKGAEMENEMRATRVRDKRLVMKANNQVVCGAVMYGYRKKEDKTIGLDEETAPFVREIFNRYAEGTISLKKLASEFVMRGIFNCSKNVSYHRLIDIVNNLAYSGRKPTKSTNVYPAIVTEELQDRCLEIKKGKRSAPKSTTKYVYFGKGIIRNKETNRVMSPHINKKLYTTNKYDEHKINISLNVIDTIAMREGLAFKALLIDVSRSSNLEKYEANIETYKKQIEKIEELKGEWQTKYLRIYRQYEKGNVPDEVYEEDVKRIKKEILKCEKDITTSESNIVDLKMIVEKLKNTERVTKIADLEHSTDQIKKEFIDEVIDSIYVSVRLEGVKKIHVIEVKPKEIFGIVQKPYYEYWTRGGFMHLEAVFNDNLRVPIEIIKRF